MSTINQWLPAIMGLLGTLSSAGPWGIASMGLGIVSLGIVAMWIIKKFNSKTDARDMADAGADPGETSLDLRNQSERVDAEIDRLTKEAMEKKDDA